MRTVRPCLLPSQPASRAMLLAAGVTDQMLRTRLNSGEMVRVRRGVFVGAADWPDDPVGRHLVVAHAEQVVHPTAVLSHQSAALAWGLPHPGFQRWHELSPSVTLPAATGAKSRPGPTVHHVGRLPGNQVARDRDGYAVTAVARTAVDLAAGLPLPEALVLLDAAARQLCEGMVVSVRRSDYANPRLIQAAREMLLEAAGTRRPAGLAPVIALAEPCRESAAESLSAGHIHLAGLPTPLFQPPVRTPVGLLYPDCLWPEHRVVGECDGAVKYTDPNASVREKEREQVLRDCEFKMVRWLAREIMTDPQKVVARIRRKLDEVRPSL